MCQRASTQPTTKELHTVACSLCGSEKHEHLLTKRGFNVVRCKACGLVYVNPRPGQAELTATYRADSYFRAQVSTKDTHQFLARARERMHLIEEVLGRTGDLVDVGCSIGLFLHEAAKRGWKTYGIDVNDRAVHHARQTFGLDAAVGTWEDTALKPHSFDVVTFFDSIEHVPNPTRALQKAWQVLKPGGVLVIRTPDIDGFLPRWTYSVLCRPFGIWEHPTPPDHLYEFSMETITRLAEKAGFRVCQAATENIPLGYTVSELRSTIIDVVNRGLKRAVDHGHGVHPTRTANRPVVRGKETRPRLALIRRILRGALLIVCYALILPPYLCGTLVGQGNETLIVARKMT